MHGITIHITLSVEKFEITYRIIETKNLPKRRSAGEEAARTATKATAEMVEIGSIASCRTVGNSPAGRQEGGITEYVYRVHFPKR
jgi:hypothetical protein